MMQIVASKMKDNHLNDAENYIRKDVTETKTPDLSWCDLNFGDIAWVRFGSYSWWPAQIIDEKGVSPNSKPRKKAVGEVLVRLYGTYNYLYIDPVKNNEGFENKLKQNNGNIRKVLEQALEEDLSRIKGRRKTKKELSGSREMQDRSERNEEEKLIACGKHARVGALEFLVKDNMEEQKVKEKIKSKVRKNQDIKRKLKQQDITKPGQDEVEEQKVKAKHVVRNQRLEKKLKLTDKTGCQVSKCNSKTQDSGRKSKQQYAAKHDKAVIHGPGKHVQVAKAPDASARRIKVMQSLGLIAPSGSPFHKGGSVKAASCES
uniref:Putative histone-lysine N-methyltransferase NSD2 n=1 Tax=Anthurium amnicola TaxID=1678845 RepID=A0A1D1ZC72_9ARAE